MQKVKQAKTFFFSTVSTNTMRNSSLTIFGTIGSGIIGMIFYIWMAKVLGPQSFGVFSVTTTTIGLLVSISNAWAGAGLVRFVGKYISKDPSRALKFLKLGLIIKLTLWIGISIIGYFAIPWVANTFLEKEELITPLRIGLIGVGSLLLFSFSATSLQAIQKFILWTILMVSNNLIRLIVAGLLFILGLLTLKTGLWTFVLVPFLGFVMGIIFLPSFWSKNIEPDIKRDFFRYNKWVFAFTVFTAISSRLDMFMVAKYLPLKEVGIYSLAVTLSSFVSQITSGVGTVVAPKMSGFDTKNVAITYIKKLQLMVSGLAIIGIVSGTILGYLLINYIFGSPYQGSFYPFLILLLAQIIFFLAIPAHTCTMYYFSNPRLFLWLSIGFLIIVGGLGYILIPTYGALGGAFTVLVAQFFNFIFPAIWVIKKLSQTR